MFTAADHQFMARALDLARRGLQTTSPNPRVGCVIVKDGEIVGEGWHRRAGEPHAEALALAAAAGRARGATVYVTLEPCSHFGRTPPCVDALIEARVGRVVAAMEDPNPFVNGQGLERLRAAGIDVRCGLLHEDAAELNIGFVSRMARGMPWVRMKVAASLDGKTALHDGRSQWITGKAARIDGHAWRARACAILTGIGTVRDDDPQLTVREVETTRQPIKVLVDSRLQVDPHARLLTSGQVLIACAHHDPDKERELRDRGCEIIHLPEPPSDDPAEAGRPPKVDLRALIGELAVRGLNEIHVEAGFKLNGSLMRAGLVDELLVYLAPSLLGDAAGMFDLPALGSLDDRRRLKFVDTSRVGDDLRIVARVQRDASTP
ncbi:MAG: bifunctional diaminohydroxyphosphoribosylaminopyrimidine deaminase/5-amino-6-(5-phosphoribosylamino)uracil reductase RibD [Burkholderiaceae bacterium]